MGKTWSVAEAKARLSDLINEALSGAPQTITRRGRSAVVVVSAEEWERREARRGTLAEFLATAPVDLTELLPPRSKDGMRKIKL